MTPPFSSADHARPPGIYTLLLPLLLLLCHATTTAAMTPTRKLALREEARTMFRHGWDSYWEIAFPEDEVKPLTCIPHHRDRANPKDIGTNDAMGEFSLTAIDALSSMAVMAASDEVEAQRFWETAEELVRIYWYNKPKDQESDRRNASSSWGRFQGRHRNTRGFDIDAKVQVFETTIRGLGGLLSAHLFAIGSLPGLPKEFEGKTKTGFVYNNELLHLAEDLGRRLLPALTKSPTGIPYPRINLRHGLPHGIKNPRYYNRILGCPQYHPDPDSEPEHPSERFWRHPNPKSIKRERPDEEITETCTAGAGSLVLEFTTLSRLTGDPRFEEAAKKAFDAIWSRRSAIGLVGAGVDAESGLWTGANSGIGAGVDSFFEYAFKSYVLLAGNADESYFLDVWEKARTALERHVLVREPATWWNNVHVNTGVGIQGGAWIDSLGGFFAGTLSQAGGASEDDDALDLAVKGNLVYSALWNRYNALPERFNTRLSTIEGGLSWYPGRPEFVESTYLLYRATKDPFWLHVGEMAMRDLKRRCWARCGWAGLQDVRTGEKQNRMESFWLSETWKYLFLLFDEANPLHTLDAPWVFTTEGHPIILPRPSCVVTSSSPPPPRTCRAPPTSSSFFSTTASRPDLFHAAYFTKLHLSQIPDSTVSSSDPGDLYVSPTNSTFYPYTLPLHLIQPNATSAPLPTRDSLELLFPEGFAAPNGVATSTILSRFTPKIQRVPNGVRILSLNALRLSLIDSTDTEALRINKVSGIHLGREELVYISRDLIDGIKDTNFDVVPDTEVLELHLTFHAVPSPQGNILHDLLSFLNPTASSYLSSLSKDYAIPAVISRGEGATPISDFDAADIFISSSTACSGPLPYTAPIIVVKRGGCTFADKIANIPDDPSVRLIVVEDFLAGTGVEGVVAPVVDGIQRNVRGHRTNQVGLVMVRSGVRWWEVESVAVRKRVGVRVQGREVSGLVVD